MRSTMSQERPQYKLNLSSLKTRFITLFCVSGFAHSFFLWLSGIFFVFHTQVPKLTQTYTLQKSVKRERMKWKIFLVYWNAIILSK